MGEDRCIITLEKDDASLGTVEYHASALQETIPTSTRARGQEDKNRRPLLEISPSSS